MAFDDQKHCVERFLSKFVGGKPPKAFTEKKTSLHLGCSSSTILSMKNTFGMNSDLELSSPWLYQESVDSMKENLLVKLEMCLAPWKQIHVFSFSLLCKKKEDPHQKN